MRLPNGYGSVFKLSGNRRNPWVARKTVGWTDNHEKRTSYPKYKAIGYYPTRKAAMEALVEYNKNPYDLGKASMTLEAVQTVQIRLRPRCKVYDDARPDIVYGCWPDGE